MIPEQILTVVVLTQGGCEVFLELLSGCNFVEIAGVFLEAPSRKRRSLVEKLKRSLKYEGYLATVRKFFAIVSGKKTRGEKEIEEVISNQADLIRLCAKLGIPAIPVADFHDDAAKELLRSLKPDLGIVYGTNILRKSVFSIPRLGSINMHQGLAPKYRGGPSVFWELLNNESEVGITVHTVESKVDTGEIIAQATVPLEYDFRTYGLDYERFIEDFRASLIRPAAELMVSAVSKIAIGQDARTIQDPSQGHRYRLPTKKEKSELIRRLKRRMRSSARRTPDSGSPVGTTR